MALIKRQKPNDSIKKFEMSAEHKYQAGLALINSGDDATGTEQLGYSAEMLLKSAYFRFMKSRLGLQRTTSVITYRMLAVRRLRGYVCKSAMTRRAITACCSGPYCWRRRAATHRSVCPRTWRKACGGASGSFTASG